jgi:hypothetical protein
MIGLVFSACGYRFVGGGSFPSGIRAVFVEVFENRTADTGVENILTNELIYEISRGTNTYLADKDRAEGILSGSITAIATETVSWRGQNTAVERRVTASINIKLMDPDGKVVWSREGVAGTETYPVNEDKQASEENKKEAIELLFNRLAEGIYNQLTSDF